MRFSASIILSGLLATALAAPMPKKAKSSAAAAATATAAAAATGTAVAAAAATATGGATTAASGAGVLTAQAYADFQVSDGVAGKALDEIDTTDLANVAASDAQIISDARKTAEDAETAAFNPAINAASGADATALQNGKIKNKVLKLQLEVLDLQIQQAQSGTDNSAKIDEETTKLNTNIALDQKAAGQASQSVAFTADDA